MMFYALAQNKHCHIKDARVLMHQMTLNEFLKLREVVEIFSAQEEAFRRDQEIEDNQNRQG